MGRGMLLLVGVGGVGEVRHQVGREIVLERRPLLGGQRGDGGVHRLLVHAGGEEVPDLPLDRGALRVRLRGRPLRRGGQAHQAFQLLLHRLQFLFPSRPVVGSAPKAI